MSQSPQHHFPRAAGQAVAVIGMGFRFPGCVHNAKSMWAMLEEGTPAITRIPEERWPVQELQHADRGEPGRSVTFAAGVLSDVTSFDAGFFGISPREAAWLDPQQRLLLQMAHEAMEQANIPPSHLAGSACGVYVGISSLDYGQHALDDLASMSSHVMTGNTLSLAANRISYIFDLHGPSVAMDTACSSSMVALHHACQALRNKEIPLALAGGISLLLHPYSFVGFSKASMISAKGQCLPFDARADGYVRAEGGGLFLLKPLKAALQDKNPIQAVILASGINTDGARKNGLTIPSREAQAELMARVLEDSGLTAEDLAFIEAHGTGTPVGDPVEVASIGDVFGAQRSTPVPITSVKAHVGHLEPASGMAGLVKAILCLRHHKLPALPFAWEPNPAIDFTKANVVCAAQSMELSDGQLYAGVNSFGFGGANAHILLQAAPDSITCVRPDTDNRKQTACAAPVSVDAAPPLSQPSPSHSQEGSGSDRPSVPLFLSAKSEDSLQTLAGLYADTLKEAQCSTPDSLYDIAFGASQYRDRYDKGLALMVEQNPAEAIAALQDFAKGAMPATGLLVREDRLATAQSGIVFVYSGNGAQWLGMGRSLYQTSSVFAASIAEVDALLQPLLKHSVTSLLLEGDQETVQETAFSQPLLFAIQVGVTRVLASLGITPAAVTGHSVGEIAAAWAAGALSLEDAVRVIHARSTTQSMTRGSGRMAAFSCSASQCEELLQRLDLRNEVELAGINSPKNVTLSGTPDSLQTIQTHAHGSFFKLLDLDYAFHSRHMDGIRDALLSSLTDLAPHPSDKARFFSTVTGTECEGTCLNASYWWSNVRQCVRFADSIAALCAAGYTIFAEIAPHAIMQRYVRECLQAAGRKGKVLASLLKNDDGLSRLQTLALRLHLLSETTDRTVFFPKPGNPSVRLPAYPWQKTSFLWPKTSECRPEERRVHPILGWKKESAPTVWENILDPAKDTWLYDHRVGGVVVLAAAAFTDMICAAARHMHGSEHVLVEDMQILAPLAFEGAQTVRCSVDEHTADFYIVSRPRLGTGAWVPHVQGRIPAASAPWQHKTPLLPALFEKSTDLRELSAAELYDITASLGLDYGPMFRVVRSLCILPEQGLLEADIVPVALGDSGYLLPPQALDACFHSLAALYASADTDSSPSAFLPVGFTRLEVFGEQTDSLKARTITRLQVHLVKRSRRSLTADLVLLNADNSVLVRGTGCHFRAAPSLVHADTEPSVWTVRSWLSPLPEQNTDASFLPAPRTLFSQILETVWTEKTQEERTLWYEKTLPLLEAMTLSFVLQAFAGQTEGISFSELKHPCARHFADILLREGLLVSTEGTLQVTGTLPAPQELWQEILQNCPQALPLCVQTGRAGLYLDRILSGEMDSMQVLHALKKPSPVSAMTQSADNPLFSGIAAALDRLVTSCLETLPSGRRLRLLEVCAASVPEETEKHSDSVSSCLVPICRSLCAAHPHLADRIDLVLAVPGLPQEKQCHQELFSWKLCPLPDAWDTIHAEECSAQTAATLAASSFDIILARQCLYTAENRQSALAFLKNLLATNGLLWITELAPDWYAELVEGLDPAFWRSTDAGLQSGFLTAKVWEEQLTLAGFADVQCLREPAARGLEEGAFLLLAQKGQEMKTDTLDSTEVPATSFCLLSLTAALQESTLPALIAALGAELVQKGHQVRTVLLTDLSSQQEISPLSQAENLVFFVPECTPETVATYLQSVLSTVLACTSRADLQDTVPHCILVTRHGNLLAPEAAAHEASGQSMLADPFASTVTGLLRVLRNECSVPLKHIDISLQSSDNGHNEAQRLAEELCTLRYPDDAEEVALTDNGRYIPRLIPAQSTQEGSSDTILDFTKPGRLDNLVWCPCCRDEELKAHDVRVAVMATGLNFRDVMLTMGLLPDDAVENGFARANLGLEFSGCITAVGPAVTDFAPGDRVVGFGRACFASSITTDDFCIAHIPAHISYESAVTLPVTFFTAWYALKHLANLQQGERLLIHGAAGGLGMAAMQIARHLGAEVYATAGSEEKRDFLHLNGIAHVYNSRDCSFVNAILADTDGEGVDVVINSLAGEAMRQSIALLRPFGRFLELGKRDFVENTSLGLKPFKENISYFAIDADQLLAAKPDLARTLFAEVMDLLEKGILSPLPWRAFAYSEVKDAFRTMQKSQHMGKIVVRSKALCEAHSHPLAAETDAPDLLHQMPDSDQLSGTWLVSGGLGGFGLVCARHLAERGVRNLVLTSRRGMAAQGAEKLVQDFAAQGVQLTIAACDMADRDAVLALMTTLSRSTPPLQGVIHAAAVFDDKALSSMDAASFARVLAPKFLGAWNLHMATQKLTFPALRHFVLFSSISTMLGNPGQGNYVAANAGLEGLTRLRCAKGLPCTCLAWGPIGDVGYLTRHEDVRANLGRRLGAAPLSAAMAMKAFDKALGTQGYLLLANVDWETVLAGFPQVPGRLAGLQTRERTAVQADAIDFRERIKGLSAAEVTSLVQDTVRKEVAQVLSMDPAQVPSDRSLQSLGLDSLMAVELATGLEQHTGVHLPVMLFSDAPSLEIVSQRITARLQGTQDGDVSDAAETDTTAVPHPSRNSNQDESAALLEELARRHAEDLDDKALQDIMQDACTSEKKGVDHV